MIVTDFDQTCAETLALTGYTFANKELLREAYWTAGAVTMNGKLIMEGNKRLAMIGDKALALAGLTEWYQSQDARCVMDNKLQAMARDSNFVTMMRPTGIERSVVLNAGTRSVSDKTLATTVEAVLGAIYLNSGMDIGAVRQAMVRMGLL